MFCSCLRPGACGRTLKAESLPCNRGGQAMLWLHFPAGTAQFCGLPLSCNANYADAPNAYSSSALLSLLLLKLSLLAFQRLIKSLHKSGWFSPPKKLLGVILAGSPSHSALCCYQSVRRRSTRERGLTKG